MLVHRKGKGIALFLAFVLIVTQFPIVQIAKADGEPVLICGKEEHSHTVECFELPGKINYQCGDAVSADYVVHSHNQYCYDGNGSLVCPLEEMEIHQHSENCYDTKNVLICVEEEDHGHQHGDSCYEEQTVLTCELEEGEDHQHDDSCYAAEQVLMCGEEERPAGHIHTSECYQEEQILVCDQPELSLHTHSSDCFDENGTCICGMPEVKEHEHSESCILYGTSTISDTTVCGKEEHIHSAACYEDSVSMLSYNEEEECVTLTLHDIDPEGNDIITDGQEGVESIDILVPVGEAPADWAESMPTDGELIADCVWYTLDEAGNKTLYDMTVPASEDLAIYTYSYQLTLTFGDDVLTVTKRESFPFADEDFVQDGVDFSEGSYILSDTGESFDLEELKTSGISRNIDAIDEGSWIDEDSVILTLHDIDWQGNDVITGGQEGVESIDIFVPMGEIPAEWAESMPTDGFPIADCVWYTLDEEGNKTLFDMTAPASESLDIYTYSYLLSLTLGDSYLFVSKREGVALTANDLIKDGKDFSIGTYTIDDTGESLNLNDLKQNGLSNNIIATSAESAATSAMVVNYYVCLNGSWTKVGETSIGYGPATFNGKSRYYITAGQVESIFGKYGFSITDYNGARIFPHTNIGKSKIWADVAPQQDSHGNWMIPVGSSTAGWDMYYCPKNVSGADSYFTSSKGKNDATLKSDNGLYEICIEDPEGLAYETLPETEYVFHGESHVVTVPYYEGLAWDVSGCTYTKALNEDQSEMTISFDSVTAPITITSREGMDEYLFNYIVCYDTSVPFVKCGTFTTSMQSVYKPMQVNGSVSYTDCIETFPDGGISVLRPDKDYALIHGTQTYSGDGKEYTIDIYYTFQGWSLQQADGTTVIYQPGDVIDESVFEDNAVNNKIYLTATYNPLNADGRVSTINFYVNLDCEILDTSGDGFNSQPKNLFTHSVYSTRIFGTDGITEKQLTASTTSENAYAVNEQIRNMTTIPIQGTTAENFPTDEAVLAAIRATGNTITLDGKTVPESDLTSKNFTVRWYVLKYESTDGWHIDGILVAKAAKIAVAKTFAGDNAAIQEIKEGGYSISVSHGDTLDYTLSLNAKDEETDTSKTGYTSYDAATNTYTWALDVRQSQTYTVKENNYIMEPSLSWNTTAQYMVTNSEDASSGWIPYDSDVGVSVTATAYANDAPVSSYQTANLKNTYIQAGIMTINKIDSVTNHGLSGVSFLLSGADGEDTITLRKKPGEQQYSVKDNASEYGYTETCTDNIVTTDANGNIYLELNVGSYYLEEIVPTGYDAAKKIQVTVTDNGTVEMASVVVSGEAEPAGGWIEGENTHTLTIKNHSRLLTTVRVEKDWGSVPSSEQLPVTVELRRDGAKLPGSQYTQVLSADNGWAYEWHDLPLFADMELAQYSVSEVKIGNTSYDSSADNDGYADFAVTYDDILYREGEGAYKQSGYWVEDGEIHYSDNALLRIHNRLTTGTIGFTKVNEEGTPLAGAVFGLYSDADCLNELDRAVSDDYGYVEFPGHGAGTYYLKEITAPTGYELKDAVYRAEISGGVARIFDDTDTPITSVINEKSSSSGIILPETGRAGTKRVLRSGAMAIFIGFLLMWAFLPEQRREKRKLVRLNRFQRTPKK